MRIQFREITRAKKAAKVLTTSKPGLKLSAAQEGLARIFGYRDWHHLMRECHPTSVTTPRDQAVNALSESKAISLTLRISEAFGFGFGDALYVLAQMHLPGIDMTEALDYEGLWLRLFWETQRFGADKRSPGSVVRISSETPSLDGQIAILKKYDSQVKIVTHHTSDLSVADYEVVFPRRRLPLFIPSRLKLAYGIWTEPSGSRVLFSRDYKPLWRLTVGRKPSRVPPWVWIDYTEQKWFWDDSNAPWYSTRRQKQEEHRLLCYGIVELPKLVEVLPSLVFDTSICKIPEAVDIMARREDADVVCTQYGWMRQ